MSVFQSNDFNFSMLIIIVCYFLYLF